MVDHSIDPLDIEEDLPASRTAAVNVLSFPSRWHGTCPGTVPRWYCGISTSSSCSSVRWLVVRCQWHQKLIFSGSASIKEIFSSVQLQPHSHLTSGKGINEKSASLWAPFGLLSSVDQQAAGGLLGRGRTWASGDRAGQDRKWNIAAEILCLVVSLVVLMGPLCSNSVLDPLSCHGRLLWERSGIGHFRR